MAEKRPKTGQPLLRAIGFDSTYASASPSFSFNHLGNQNYRNAHSAASLKSVGLFEELILSIA